MLRLIRVTKRRAQLRHGAFRFSLVLTAFGTLGYGELIAGSCRFDHEGFPGPREVLGWKNKSESRKPDESRKEKKRSRRILRLSKPARRSRKISISWSMKSMMSLKKM